jgi:DNA-binding IclR family transcriptional regulator
VVLSDRSNVKSASRVVDLLELLARWGREMTHAEIVQALGIPKSSLSHLLATLRTRGYVEFLAERRTYVLGKAVAALARQTMQLHDVIALIGPVLRSITEATNESSALGMLKGDHLEVVAKVDSPHRFLYHLRLGDTAPLYASSGGKVILAHLSPEMLEEYLTRVDMKQITPKTITAKSELRRELKEATRLGFAYSREELTLGVVSVSMAVLNGAGTPIAALSIGAPLQRFDKSLDRRARRALEQAMVEVQQSVRKLDSD